MIRLCFLGTGTSQGVPVIACECSCCTSQDSRDKRLRSSVYIETADVSLVIDTGPDFRQQMLREHITKLDAVLLTHAHKDHIGGLDDVRAFNFIQKRPMDVYAAASVQNAIKREFAYAFARTKYPGVPQIVQHVITTRPFFIGNTEVIPVKAKHSCLNVLGYRIGDMAYLTDVSEINRNNIRKLRGLKVLVINALRKKPHHSHFNLEQALQLIYELKPETAYLTHISHIMGRSAEVETELPENVFLAFDGLKLEI